VDGRVAFIQASTAFALSVAPLQAFSKAFFDFVWIGTTLPFSVGPFSIFGQNNNKK